MQYAKSSKTKAVADAFTEARLQVLEIVASQAGIVLENARLYADMRLQAAERRAISLQEG